MILIEEYITLPVGTRKKHIELDDQCIERGGPQNGGLSSYCKGLMAHLLDTSIPSGHKIHICHACNNEKCSNPKHLYWGTARENSLDRMNNGDKTVWQKVVEKYGIEEARKINAKGNKAAGGKAGAGRSKSEEQKKKQSESTKEWWKKRKGQVA